MRTLLRPVFTPLRSAAALALGAALALSTNALADAAFASSASAVSPAAPVATETAAIAWSVQTVDGEHGEKRPNFSYEVDPGTVLNDAMRVTNTGSQPLDLTIYAADAYTTPSGNIDLDTPDLVPDDAGAWIKTDVDRLMLQPGQQADIHFTVTVPEDARPGDHSAGIVTSLMSTQGGTLSVDRRLVTRATVRVSGELTPAVEVSDVTARYRGSWNPFAPGVLSFDYTLTNSGNTRVSASEAITAGSLFGLLSSTQPSTSLGEVIPGSTIEVHREIEMLPGGVVSGALVLAPEAVGLGAQGMAQIELEYSAVAVPWALLVLLGLIALVVVLVLLWRRRRVAASKESTASAGDAATE